jgi:hypothetical protein
MACLIRRMDGVHVRCRVKCARALASTASLVVVVLARLGSRHSGSVAADHRDRRCSLDLPGLPLKLGHYREDASADRSNNASRWAASWSTAFQFDLISLLSRPDLASL